MQLQDFLLCTMPGSYRGVPAAALPDFPLPFKRLGQIAGGKYVVLRTLDLKISNGAIASMDAHVRDLAKMWLCSSGMALCPSCRCCMQACSKHAYALLSSSSPELARWTSTPTAAN